MELGLSAQSLEDFLIIYLKNNMFKNIGATRVVLYVVIFTLCVLIFITVRGEKFDSVFDLFKTVVVAIVSFFFGKSTQESMSATTGATQQPLIENTTSTLEK
jgi:EamA domain-containing membrane protein RarD